MAESEKTVQSNLSAAERGRKAMDDLEAYSKDPERIGQELLFKILKDNENTEYGRKVGFSEIKTVEDYKKKIPLTVYDDYAEYVVRVLTGKEEHLHSVYGVAQYNRSSGTMGNPKKIPMSSISMKYLLDYAWAVPFGMAAKRFGTDFLKGKALSVAEASARAVVGNPPKRYFGVSGQCVVDWQMTFPEMFTSPLEAVCPDKETDSRYLHARYGLAYKNVTSLQTTFITFILDLFHFIKDKWEMLCDDIESGKIDPSVKMSDAVRSKLESELVPMPERAAELRKIFSDGFDNTIAKRIWPNLTFIMGISTGTFSAYLSKLREDFLSADVPIAMVGVSASEGAISSPYDFDTPDFALLGHTIFFEFLPLDEDDPSKTCTISEVELGKEYEIILTTQSGLYRYRTRDAIRFVRKYNNLPTMEYLYRIDMCINLNGEKTYEPALRAAMDATAKELDFYYTDFCVYADTDTTPSCYHFFIECPRRPKVGLEELSACLQKELIKTNPILDRMFGRELMGPVVSDYLQDETYALWRDKQIMMGGASTQIKPVKIIMNEAQLRFFRVLVDKEEEQ